MTIRRRLFWIVVTGLAAALFVGLAAERSARGRAAAIARADAVDIARAHVALLTSELQKFRLLPLVLGEYPDVPAALTGDAAARADLSRTLELLAARTNAATIYVIGRDGVTVSASNWRRADSLVGLNYGFRPYFLDAMRRGGAELFAMGTVSRRPGLYLSRRVERGGRTLGVVVVKVEFDAVEVAWARAGGATFVVDPRGGILVTSNPAWRFRTLGPPDPGLIADARRTLQFGSAPPQAAPIVTDGRSARATLDGREARFQVATLPAPLAGMRLIHLTPLDPALAAARQAAAIWALVVLIAAGLAAAIALRARDTRRIRAALEEAVARRTAELRDANARLQEESEERLAADRRYRTAREELAQANRLGTLGQVTAGVAHEINQPVAAIRTFAENGAAFLDRGDSAEARANLDRIVGLADRIGRITAELRGFARRRTPAGGTTTLGAALEGALLIVGERARGVLVDGVEDALRAVPVRGERVRIEQVIVNLVQNALDAVEGRAERRVALTATRDSGLLRLVVADNGPGIDAALAAHLFTPFTTGKANGLGLGLAIARDIARDVGGELALLPGAGGARFELTLRTM